MAQRALPPGAIRRRAVFGLLDADGWTWAGLRAAFWFLVIVFMLGYIPNRSRLPLAGGWTRTTQGEAT